MKIKKGTTRHVFLIGKYAIKIPCLSSWRMFLNDLLSNMQERAFWNELHHPLLAEIYYADVFGIILIMERADVTYYEHGRRGMNKFFDRCQNEGLPVDRHASNIGKFGKKWKLIDYGN